MSSVAGIETERIVGGSLRSTIPTATTPLIGRQWEIAAAVEILSMPDVRLVTITGPGGVGKTRLSLEIAERVAAGFADGVQIVPLAPISDPSLVVAAIASALGIRDDSTRPLLDRIKTYLRRRNLLLVADNFEQVVTAGPLIIELLSAAPGVKVLVTSRAALRVRGEREFPLSPFPLPDLKPVPELAALRETEAVRLFMQAATAVKPGFQLTPENASTIAGICVRLDGLPLAIELAAARVRILTPAQLLERLGNSLNVLTGGPRDLPARQQTLRDAIAWSFDLLEETERRIFRRLAVFRGGATLSGIEAVCTLPADPPIDILEIVTSLLDKSMLRQREEENGDVRFQMLETIREYAGEQLQESGEEEETRRQHALYYREVARQAGSEALGKQQQLWMLRTDAELDNIREALTWDMAHGEYQLALETATGLARYWTQRGLLHEGPEWFQKIFAFREKLDPLEYGLALNQYGSLLWGRGEVPPALEAFHTSRRILEEIGDRRNLARVFNNLGNISAEAGNIDEAGEFYRWAYEIRRDLDERRDVITSLIGLGNIASMKKDHVAASRYYEEGLALSREFDDVEAIMTIVMNLGVTSFLDRDYDRSMEYFEEGLAIARHINHRRGMAPLLTNMAKLATARGEYERAMEWNRESMDLFLEMGNMPGYGFGHAFMAMVYTVQGRTAEAGRWYRDALTMLSERDVVDGIIFTLYELAWTALVAGHPEEAAILTAGADRIFEGMPPFVLEPDDLERYEEMRRTLATRFGEERYRTLREEGWKMSQAEIVRRGFAVARMLEETPLPAAQSSTGQSSTAHPSAGAPIEPRSFPEPPYPSDLTTREVEVLRHVALGLSDAEVGEKLFISRRTVHAHLRSIYSKLGVTTRAEASRFATEQGLA